MTKLFLLILTIGLYAQSFDTYTGTYTGSGGDDSTIVVANLTPAGKHTVVIVKGVSADLAVWRSSAHVGDVSSRFYQTADGANAIQSFSSTGFVIGTDATVNTKDAVYHYAVVLADTSLMYCRSYTGNGTTQNVSVPITDIGLAWIKNPGAVVGVWRSSVFGTDSTTIFSGGMATTSINSFGSGTVNIENGAAVNTNAVVYHLVVFANSPAIANVRYKGDGNDNRDIALGKTLTGQAFVLNSKEAASSANTITTAELNSDKTLLLSATATVYTNMLQAFTATAVNIGAHVLVNASGVRYYMSVFGDYTTLVPASTDTKPVGAGGNLKNNANLKPLGF